MWTLVCHMLLHYYINNLQCTHPNQFGYNIIMHSIMNLVHYDINVVHYSFKATYRGCISTSIHPLYHFVSE